MSLNVLTIIQLGRSCGCPHIVFGVSVPLERVADFTKTKLHPNLGITLGTGIGSAFCLQGRVVTQGRGVPRAGEIYNLPWKQGTGEDTISTRRLVEMYRELSGESISVGDIAGRVASDQRAQAAIEQFGANLGQILNAVLRDFNPQVIVLGGGISGSSELFLPSMVRELTSLQPRILVCDCSDRAALLGAAHYWDLQMTLPSVGDEPCVERMSCL